MICENDIKNIQTVIMFESPTEFDSLKIALDVRSIFKLQTNPMTMPIPNDAPAEVKSSIPIVSHSDSYKSINITGSRFSFGYNVNGDFDKEHIKEYLDQINMLTSKTCDGLRFRIGVVLKFDLKKTNDEIKEIFFKNTVAKNYTEFDLGWHEIIASGDSDIGDLNRWVRVFSSKLKGENIFVVDFNTRDFKTSNKTDLQKVWDFIYTKVSERFDDVFC